MKSQIAKMNQVEFISNLELLITSEQIDDAACGIAQELQSHHGFRMIHNPSKFKKPPLFVVVLGGAFMFASKLIENYDEQCEVAFVKVASYNGVEQGELYFQLQIDSTIDIKDRSIVIVEDIVESGRTVNKIVEHLIEKGVNSDAIVIATLLIREREELLNLTIESGFTLTDQDGFVIGAGLDFEGYGRNLQNLYKIKSQSYLEKLIKGQVK